MTEQAQRPIILLIGLPGSGKSTWARDFLAHSPEYRVVSTDATRAALYGDEALQGDWTIVWRAVQDKLQQYLQEMEQGLARGVLYDATNARRRYRRRLIGYLKQLGYGPVGAVWFDLPLDWCLERNAQRERQVPVAIIERMQRQLQGGLPSVAEGLDFLIRWR